MIGTELFFITSEVIFILLLGFITRDRINFFSMAINGGLLVVGGGVFLWNRIAIGYLFLVYGAFLSISGIKENELLRISGKPDRLGWFLLVFGNFLIAATILQMFALYYFWPTYREDVALLFSMLVAL